MTSTTTVKRAIIGQSPVVQQMLKMIQRVAAAKTNVLVIGESGTGKELVARMIHDSGPLDGKPFVPVNCGAIPPTLIESELFGHKRGSFTGAVSEKMGLFEVANGGTLFLDEVGELPLGMQVKLLRAIQERVIKRVGGNEDIRIDVRIIAATNRDLEAAVAKGTFREDLYYRLNVILIRTPSLREREGDIRLLVEHFLQKNAKKYPNAPKALDPEALTALENYGWPGNVRELENVIERAVTLETGKTISLESLTPAVRDAVRKVPTEPRRSEDSKSPGVPSSVGEIVLPAPDFSKGNLSLDEILGEVERAYLLAALEHSKGVKKEAAALLGITFRSIRYRLAKLGIERGES
jgi:two-component system response regulator PilR (NtrC family)